MARWLKPPEDDILLAKARLKVTLYGSYDNTALHRLRILQRCLAFEGYRAELVKDKTYPSQTALEDEHVYNLRKSKYWLQKSDVNLMIFFSSVSNDSVIIELAALCTEFRDKVLDSGVFFHVNFNLRSLVEGTMKVSKIYHDWFRKDTTLCVQASWRCLNILKLKYSEII